MSKKSENKSGKKLIYYILAIVLAAAIIVAICMTSCEKKEIIGYDPPTPQEWLDDIEAEKNRPDMDVDRTYDLDGVWKDNATGQLYQVYMGHIFELDNLTAAMGDYRFYGTVVAIQNVLKEDAENYSADGGNEMVADEKFSLYLSGGDVYEATLTIIDGDNVKTVTPSGEEFNYTYVEFREEWPEGFR